MAKQQQPAAGTKPPGPPANWGSMSREERVAWREKNRAAPAPAGTTPAPAPAPAPGYASSVSPAPAAAGYDASSGERTDDDDQVQQIGSDVANKLTNEDARGLVSKILRAVADALDYGSGVE